MDNPNLLRDLGINQSKAGASSEAVAFPQAEFDALMDHIDKYGTTAEGIKALAKNMIHVTIAAPTAPAVAAEASDIIHDLETALAELEGIDAPATDNCKRGVQVAIDRAILALRQGAPK